MADPRKEEKGSCSQTLGNGVHVTAKEGGWVGLTHQKIWNIADTA